MVSDLTFVYPGATQPVFSRLSLRLPAGARCLLLGANGTGKSTLLRLIAGRHMIAHEVIRVLGRPAIVLRQNLRSQPSRVAFCWEPNRQTGFNIREP